MRGRGEGRCPFRWKLALLLVVGVGALRTARGEQVTEGLAAEEFRARVERLADELGPSAVAVLKGAPKPDRFRPFRQYNTFYYFSGYAGPDAVLVVRGRGRKQVAVAATLYVPWPARVHRQSDELRARGITEIRPATRLAADLKELAESSKVFYVQSYPGEGMAQARDAFHRPFPLLPGYRPVGDVAAFRAALRQLLADKQVALKPIEPISDAMRRVKSKREIELMRRAARITALALRAAIRRTRPGILEAELAGVCEATFLTHGARGSAWTPIVASGPNMVELHYMRNNRTLAEGDMLLIDAGPDYHYYTSDVTRCWPVSGPFPPRYAELYDKLVEVHRAGIAMVRPGKTMFDVLRAMQAKARELGIGRYLLPVAGHYTGMAVHDVGKASEPFVPGVVFNVEPLLMVRKERLHLRLEDTVLCTEGDPEVLTPLELLPWERDAILAIRDGGQDGN